jgi:hypothetical protein
MGGGLLAKTYYIAGRAIRLGGNSVMAVANAPVRLASWTSRFATSSAKYLNPLNLLRGRDGERSRGIPAPRLPAPRPPALVKPPAISRGAEPAVPPAPEDPKPSNDFPAALKSIRAGIKGIDPTEGVTALKVVADLETLLHSLGDSAPTVSQMLKTALEGIMQVLSGEITDTDEALSDIAHTLEVAEQLLSSEEDPDAQAKNIPSPTPPTEVEESAPPPEPELEMEPEPESEREPEPEPEPEPKSSLPVAVTQEEAAAGVFEGSREKVVFGRALESISDERATARARAVRAMGGIRHELSTRAVAACLARDSSADVRKECVSALTILEGAEAVPSLKSALQDESAGVRLAAVQGVYRLAGAKGASSLVRMFADKHEDVRRRAVACVGWLGLEHLAGALIPLLKDDHVFVRQAALEALANLKSLQAVDRIIDLLEDTDETVGKKAFEVLGIITGKRMVDEYPKDEYDRQLLAARWRARQETMPWLSQG